MDFFERQDQARRNTRLLVVYFVLAVVLIVAAVYLFRFSSLPARHVQAGHLCMAVESETFAQRRLHTLAIILGGALQNQ